MPSKLVQLPGIFSGAADHRLCCRHVNECSQMPSRISRWASNPHHPL